MTAVIEHLHRLKNVLHAVVKARVRNRGEGSIIMGLVMISPSSLRNDPELVDRKGGGKTRIKLLRRGRSSTTKVEECSLGNGYLVGAFVVIYQPLLALRYHDISQIRRWGKIRKPTLISRCSLVSANLTEIRHPGSFHPLTILPCSLSMISSAAARVSSLIHICQPCRKTGAVKRILTGQTR